MRALLDTSFFVARESGRRLGEIPDVSATEVSVVTLAELTVGVLIAKDSDRAKRLATLSAVESRWDPLPIDAEVARQFARIVANLRMSRKRVPILDALMAATALVEHMPVVTRNRDYDGIPGLEVTQV
jgi:predicted nucleic acid-binding protein